VDDNRTLPATERQRQRFAARGDIAKSPLLASAGVLLAGAAVVSFAGGSIAQAMIGFARLSFGDLDHLAPGAAIVAAGRAFVAVAGPFMLAGVVGAVGLGFAQTRGAIAEDAVGFDFERLNPFPRLQQMFASRDAVISLVTSLVKTAVVGAVIYATIKGRLEGLLTHVPASLGDALARGSDLLSTLLLRAGLATLFLGVADYGVSWFRLEQRMRMTFDEVREEAKDDLGNPQVRQRRRRRMRELLRQRSLRDVPKADVVVTNPTHFAVAIVYKSKRMSAPRVVAKGADLFAKRIRELAQRSGVPVIEEPPLARALYKRVKVGKEVPAELYKAVAVILAHVYRLRRRRSA
jgi:flagellar biosynthetic protein FlhB